MVLMLLLIMAVVINGRTLGNVNKWVSAWPSGLSQYARVGNSGARGRRRTTLVPRYDRCCGIMAVRSG